MEEKAHARKRRALTTDLKVMNEVKKLQANPELGAYRIHTALLRIGINLSPRTCGRILALNRHLYHLPMPRKTGRSKAVSPFKAERRHQLWSGDIGYLDMPRLGGGEIYCLSVLENFSRAVLASAVSRRQDPEAYFAILYAAIRTYGIPEGLVSDRGSVFLSQEARRVYDALGIEKKEIKKGRPWQNYIETMCNVQRRMADWYFEKAQTWEDLLAAHEKWVLEYNFQHHVAHEKREDGCHSPAAVLGWITGMQPEPDLVHRVFAAICETRTLNKAGYAKFRNFLLYGEHALAGKKTLVNIFQDLLTWEYAEHPLTRYWVEWQPDDKHLLRVGQPRLYNHPYRSLQVPLWESGDVEWHVIIRCQPLAHRPRQKGRVFIWQPMLFADLDPPQG